MDLTNRVTVLAHARDHEAIRSILLNACDGAGLQADAAPKTNSRRLLPVRQAG